MSLVVRILVDKSGTTILTFLTLADPNLLSVYRYPIVPSAGLNLSTLRPVFPHHSTTYLEGTVNMASQAQIDQIMLLVESGIPLTEIPAGRPPPGQVSHLHHAIGRAHMITTCDIICVIIVCTVVAMRMYTRVRLLKSLWWDDCESAPAIPLSSKANKKLRVHIIRSRMLDRRNRIVPIRLPIRSRQARLRH